MWSNVNLGLSTDDYIERCDTVGNIKDRIFTVSAKEAGLTVCINGKACFYSKVWNDEDISTFRRWGLMK